MPVSDVQISSLVGQSTCVDGRVEENEVAAGERGSGSIMTPGKNNTNIVASSIPCLHEPLWALMVRRPPYALMARRPPYALKVPRPSVGLSWLCSEVPHYPGHHMR